MGRPLHARMASRHSSVDSCCESRSGSGNSFSVKSRYLEIFLLVLRENAFTVKSGAGVKPADGFDRRLVQRFIIRNIRTACIACGKLTIGLDIDLFDTAKASKLTFDAVKITVMIAIGRGETGLTPFVRHHSPFPPHAPETAI